MVDLFDSALATSHEYSWTSVAEAVLVVAMGMIWLGAKLRARRSQAIYVPAGTLAHSPLPWSGIARRKSPRAYVVLEDSRHLERCGVAGRRP